MGCYLHIGGLVALGFDPSGEFLLVITHSGRGVFSTRTWERLSRSTELAYPEGGFGVGIGPHQRAGHSCHRDELYNRRDAGG